MQPNAAQILDELRKSKLVETRAKERRITLESDLIDALEFTKSKGSTTYDVGGVKVTLTQPITQTVDASVYEALEWPEKWTMVRRKYTVDAKAFKEASDADRLAMSAAITTKPGKVSVVVKEVKS